MIDHDRRVRRRLFTLREIAALANLDVDTVRRHVRKGALAVVYIGPAKRIRVRLEAAHAYLGTSGEHV